MSFVLMNEEYIHFSKSFVHIEDRGFQFGDGIYEVIGLYNGKLFLLDEHLHRLETSAQEIDLTLTITMAEMNSRLLALIGKNTIQDGMLYVQLTRGVASRSHPFPNQNIKPQLVAYVKSLPSMVKKQREGIHAITTPDMRWLRCNIKSTNLLANVLAKEKAIKAGAFEAILHRGEIVTEGSSSNLFIVKNGIVYTHPSNNLILTGITRQKIIEICKKLSINLVEEVFTLQDLLKADETFMSATRFDILPVIKVNDSLVGDGKPGNITREIMKNFEEFLYEMTSSDEIPK